MAVAASLAVELSLVALLTVVASASLAVVTAAILMVGWMVATVSLAIKEVAVWALLTLLMARRVAVFC